MIYCQPAKKIVRISYCIVPAQNLLAHQMSSVRGDKTRVTILSIPSRGIEPTIYDFSVQGAHVIVSTIELTR